jgi:hypothetical protein
VDNAENADDPDGRASRGSDSATPCRIRVIPTHLTNSPRFRP